MNVCPRFAPHHDDLLVNARIPSNLGVIKIPQYLNLPFQEFFAPGMVGFLWLDGKQVG